MLFGKKKEDTAGLLFSPASGKAVPIAEAPDQVFSAKILGDGIAVILEDGRITAPADGKIVTVADTLHAYGMTTDGGLELLVHIGLETVALGGKGFRCKVREGQKVKKGAVLCEVDLDVLRENNCSLYTPVVITNLDSLKSYDLKTGDVVSGETVILEYEN